MVLAAALLVMALRASANRYEYGHEPELGSPWSPEYAQPLQVNARRLDENVVFTNNFSISDLCFTQETVTTALNTFKLVNRLFLGFAAANTVAYTTATRTLTFAAGADAAPPDVSEVFPPGSVIQFPAALGAATAGSVFKVQSGTNLTLIIEENSVGGDVAAAASDFNEQQPIKACLDYMVDLFDHNKVNFSEFPKLKIFYDGTRLVSLDNRRLAITKEACAIADGDNSSVHWTYCTVKPVLQWASLIDIACTANHRRNLLAWTPPGQTFTCKQLGYDGNHWTSDNNGTQIEVVPTSLSGNNYARKLNCTPWYSPNGTRDESWWLNSTEMKDEFYPTNKMEQCHLLDLNPLPPVAVEVYDPFGNKITAYTFDPTWTSTQSCGAGSADEGFSCGEDRVIIADPTTTNCPTNPCENETFAEVCCIAPSKGESTEDEIDYILIGCVAGGVAVIGVVVYYFYRKSRRSKFILEMDRYSDHVDDYEAPVTAPRL